MVIRHGDVGVLEVDCDECGGRWETTGTWDVEAYEERRDLLPDETICPGCRGEGECDTRGCFELGETRMNEETGRQRELYGVYCEACWGDLCG
jgi:hypothetical protein